MPTTEKPGLTRDAIKYLAIFTMLLNHIANVLLFTYGILPAFGHSSADPGIEPARLLPALAAFSGLPHRVEFVDAINGVSYYDDSKGTNVGATLAALQGMGRKVAIILGGEGKEQDFTPLKDALAEHGRAVALIGRDAELIGKAIAGCGIPTERCSDMDAAVRWCAAQVQEGDAVLLSPACASFDMYHNMAERGRDFKHLVHELEQQK